MNQVSVEYDADLWIRVPLDYVDTRWADAAQWAEWIAGEATRGRPDAETIAPVVRSEADAEPAAMPRIEWLGVARDWVCYVATNDHDPAAVNARVIDADVLFAAVGEAARVAPSDEADAPSAAVLTELLLETGDVILSTLRWQLPAS